MIWSFLLAFHFWTLRVTCLFLIVFWYRSLPLSESDLTHYGCCVFVVKAFCKLLEFDCHYCARYWKVPMRFHPHQVSFAFMWQKLCARVKPPCLFWYLLPFKARASFVPILRAAKKPYWATLIRPTEIEIRVILQYAAHIQICFVCPV